MQTGAIVHKPDKHLVLRSVPEATVLSDVRIIAAAITYRLYVNVPVIKLADLVRYALSRVTGVDRGAVMGFNVSSTAQLALCMCVSATMFREFNGVSPAHKVPGSGVVALTIAFKLSTD